MEIDPRLKEYFDKAPEVDAGKAMDALIRIFIDACGVSAGERSMAFCASNFWRCRMMEADEKFDRSMTWRDMMALRSEEYRNNKERIDSYNYSALDPIDALQICSDMIDDYRDELTRTALCAGILFYAFSIVMSGEAEED